MSIQLKNVNFGVSRANATGSSGVGYTLIDSLGNVISSRTTIGVYQIVPNSGIYAANITIPDNFNGQILWDTANFFSKTYRAIEHYNTEEKIDDIWQAISSITGSLTFIRDMTAGRWKIENNQMKFYKEDNMTLIAVYDLYDQNGLPSSEIVVERSKVS